MRLAGSVTDLTFFENSWVFVEFFFVLSGFVLVHGYGFRNDLKFKPFMTARFYRLFPLHFFMLFIFIIFECGKWLAWKFGGFSFNTLPFTNAYAFSEIVPNFLLIHAWVPFADPFSFNSPSWSISIEFYMYALLFVSISVFRSFRVASWFMIVLLTFILIYHKSNLLVIEVQRGLFCFFGGAITYIVFLKTQNLKLKSQIFLASFVEFVLLVSVVFVTNTQIKLKGVIAPGLFCLTVFCFAFEAGVFSKILKVHLLQFIGKISFSIYMTHAGVLFIVISLAMVVQKFTRVELAPMIDAKRSLDFGGPLENNVAVIVVLMLVIFVSNFTYKQIELKGQQFNKRKG